MLKENQRNLSYCDFPLKITKHKEWLPKRAIESLVFGPAHGLNLQKSLWTRHMLICKAAATD
jgi:hypothetical protein